MSDINKKNAFAIRAICFAAIASAGATILQIVGLPGDTFGIRLFFDTHDMGVYFTSSRWAIEGGRLYREVPSEYPLLANIIFATVRYLGNLVHPGVYGFYIVWIVAASFLYFYSVYRVATDTTLLALLSWLAPAPLYFALFRFDLYPAVATLISLFAIRRTCYIEGALWLGVAGALKGYALFMLPAYCVFLVYQRGLAVAIKAGLLAIAPMLLTFLATLMFAGWEGFVAPLKFHAIRKLNGDSTYDAINYLFAAPVTLQVQEAPWIAHLLQIGCALAAAAMRPRTFQDLVKAFLFAVLGFLSFSVFYSPQFLLWILPLTCFSRSRALQMSAILLSWLTYLFFPISFDLQPTHPQLFKAVIVAISSLRLFMIALVVKQWAKCRR